MTIHYRNATTWRPVNQVSTKVNNVWREVREAYVKVSGVWRIFYAAFDPVAVSIPAQASASANFAASVNVGATITGGSGNLNYQWVITSGAEFILDNATSATVRVRSTIIGTRSIGLRCDVTDNVSGESVSSNTCLVTLTVTEPGDINF